MENSTHTTIYNNYSQSQLTALFSAENWHSLSFSEKMSACQEVENRYAAENNIQPCTVTHQPMEGASYGWQSGNTICLNSYLVQSGQFCTHYTDRNGNLCEVRTNALAPGWNTLDTVYHEGTHGIQESMGKMPSTYISPKMDSDLYRIQGIEKEAYAVGQMRTLQAMSNYEKESGKLDASRNEYIASAKNDSFQSALTNAARNYNDPNIEQTLQAVISDRENHVTPQNPSTSYQAISDLCDNYGIHSSVDIANNAVDHGTVSNNSTVAAASGLYDGVAASDSSEITGASLDDGMDSSRNGAQTDIENTAGTAVDETASSLDDGISVDIEASDASYDDGCFNDITASEDYGETANTGIDDGVSSDNGLSGGEDMSMSD